LRLAIPNIERRNPRAKSARPVATAPTVRRAQSREVRSRCRALTAPAARRFVAAERFAGADGALRICNWIVSWPATQ
jgi:glutathione S-transferase